MAFGTEDENLTLFEPRYQLIEHLDRLLARNELEMGEQIIWFYANAIGDSVVIRDKILERSKILEYCDKLIKGKCQRNVL